MEIKTAELIGARLDWVVAKCEELEDIIIATQQADGMRASLHVMIQPSNGWEEDYSPSTDWAQGGPIIELEKMYLTPQLYGYLAQGTHSDGRGPSPLIAAMRCYVASKLGDVVEIPDVLVKETNG